MPHVAARTASRDRDTGRYQSHRPEQTLLYQGSFAGRGGILR